MRRLVAAFFLLFLGLAPLAQASLRVRPARPSDDVAHTALTEWWQVFAFDPASHTWVRVKFVAKPWSEFELTFRQGNDIIRALGTAGMDVEPQKSPGVTMVERSKADPSLPADARLVFNGKAYIVDVAFPTTRAHLTIVPQRAGVTVGPWRLGREQVAWNPPAYVPGNRMWSVPVATGTASGSVEIDGHHLTLRNWRAYHDHTWGSYRFGSTSWFHSDFAVRIPRPGEAWILNGMEPGAGGYRAKPDDRRWQGVLVHVTRAGASSCSARIARGGWVPYPNHVDGWDYWLPSRVSARCGGRAFATRPEAVPWGLWGFLQALLGSSPVPGRVGWIEHATPPVPNA